MDGLLQVIDEWESWRVATVNSAKNRGFAIEQVPGFGTAILGVRRCGKSVGGLWALAEQKQPCLYLNLEDPFFVSHNGVEVLDTVMDLVAQHKGPLPKTFFFDEIQQISHWERWARKIIDHKRYALIVTGSSAKMLSSEIATSLSGRCLVQELWPLSYREYLQFRQLAPDHRRAHLTALAEYLRWGGFPEVVLQQKAFIKKNILERYQEDILFRDVVMRHHIRSPLQLKQLITFLFTNISSEHSVNSLKNAYGINMETVQNYLDYLQEAYLLFEVKSYHYNLKAQARAPRKYYCIDTGLRNEGSASPSPDWGKLAENVVYLELRRRHQEIWYFKQIQEVDFVITEHHVPKFVIQVCYDDLWSEKTKAREISAMHECLKTLSLKEGVIITSSKEEIIKSGGKTIRLLPLYKWLLLF